MQISLTAAAYDWVRGLRHPGSTFDLGVRSRQRIGGMARTEWKRGCVGGWRSGTLILLAVECARSEALQVPIPPAPALAWAPSANVPGVRLFSRGARCPVRRSQASFDLRTSCQAAGAERKRKHVCTMLPDATGEDDADEQLRVDVSLAFEATTDGHFELKAHGDFQSACGFSCRSFTDSRATFQTI